MKLKIVSTLVVCGWLVAGGLTVQEAHASFPYVPAGASGTRTSEDTDNGNTEFIVDLPTGIAAGDLIIAFAAHDKDNTATWPSPWVELVDTANSSENSLFVAYLIASGGETSVTVTTTPNPDRSHHIAIRIPAGSWHGTTPPEFSTTTTGNSQFPDSANLTPSWGAADTLWISTSAYTDFDSDGPVTSYPSSYVDNQNFYGPTGSSAGIGIATRELNAASEDPGPFALTTGNFWTAATIAVRPAVDSNYRSIGTNAANLHPAGNASVPLGSTTVTFTAALPAPTAVGAVGPGDQLDIEGEILFIRSRDSDFQVTLLSAATVDHSTPVAAFSITRAYNTLQAWETDRQGDLVGQNRREIGFAYKDGPFLPPYATANSALAINGSITDADRYMWLTVPPGQRHNGTAGTGVIADGQGATKFGIQNLDNYSRVDWLELVRFYTDVPDSGFSSVVTVGTNALYQNLLIHDFLDPDAGDTGHGMRVSTTAGPWSFTVRNSVIYDGDNAGIWIDEPSSSIVAENCTIYGMETNGVSIGASGGTVTVTNTISMNHGSNSFNALAGTLTQSNNISSDGTAAGTSPFTFRTATDIPTAAPNSVVFANLTGGSEDFHLQTSTVNDALDNGVDLSGSYCCDIDGGGRVVPWDIGADDLASTTAVKLASFSAQGFDGAIELAWETASELNNLGFHVYRSNLESGTYERITTSAIPGLGSSPVGASYTYRDTGLDNGVTYSYKLEDIETTGTTELHGPVSAIPQTGASSGGDDSTLSGDGPVSIITYGNPTASSVKVLNRGRRGVTLELLTEGFYAEPREDGSVQITIPDFAELGEAGSPSIPTKQTWVEAVAGRKVKLVSIRPREVQAFTSLYPSNADVSDIVATPEGTVRAAQRRKSLRRRGEQAFRGGGLSPSSAARIVKVGFQGEAKKALVELAPLRWDASSGQLLLARRLVVRLSFREREPTEQVLADGVRGRGHARRGSNDHRAVVARLRTRERGLHLVRYEEVMGGRRGVRARNLRLSRQGESVAYHLEPRGSRFEPGSVLYFVSDGAAVNPFGTEAVYELEVVRSGEAAEAMSVVSAAPSSKPQAFYRRVVEWERDRYYQAALVDAPDLWLWDVLFAPEVKGYPLEVSSLAPSGGASKLSVWLQGGSDLPAEPDHHVRVYVNGAMVEERSWDGKRAKHFEVELAPGLLREGDNLLELENAGDTEAAYSMVMLDRYALEYPRVAHASDGRLEGRWDQSGTAELSGLSPGAHVLDTTEAKPRWLFGTERGDDGQLRFHAEAGRRYLAVSPEAVHQPVVSQPRASRLKSPRHRADYLVIGPEAFLQTAKPLLKLRRDEGLRVKGVSIEEIYSEFGFGEPTPEAVKSFLSYAYHRWKQPSPRYVLLVGDGTFDFKNHLQTGVKNQVPPRMVKTSYLWTASDPSYAAVNGDDPLPDLAIGRLPAATVEELETMVEKIVAYETGEAGLDRSTVVLVTDDPDRAGNFEADADALAAGVLASRNPHKIYLSQLGTAATRDAIGQSFDEGASLISYIGHGGIHLWADENFFNSGDVASLRPQAQQPVLLTMNCLNGYFHFPYFDSLAETLLKADGKGVIAAFSPSGLSLNGPAHRYHEALLTELFSGKHQRFGDAVMAAQEAYAETGALPELLSIYHVLGDPAMRLR